MGVAWVDETVQLSPQRALLQAQQLLDTGRPFHAHEVLEGVWKSAPLAERPLWQGLAQLAVGVTHLRRGNDSGAQTVLARGRGNLADFADQPPYGIDVVGLLTWVERVLAGVDVRPPQLRTRMAP